MVKVIGDLLTDFGFDVFWPNDVFYMSELKTSFVKPIQVEIDIIARINDIGFIIEVTTDKNDNDKKIERKFIPKLNAIKETPLSNEDLVKLFTGVSSRSRSKFKDIKEWRGIYINGTSTELIDKKLTPDKFSKSIGLSIINIDDLNYINAMKKAIGKFAKYEFYSFLNLDLDEIEEIIDKDKYFEFIRLKRRLITKENIDADLFVFSASPDVLLRTCKVCRFQGLPLDDADSYYQRMLSVPKLKNIRKFIKKSNKLSFPTPITVILPSNVKTKVRPDGKEKLEIIQKYGVFEVIDGQHRLFAYASNEISDLKRKKVKLLVNGVKFNTESVE